MAAVMIGVDPHKGSHTAVAVGTAEEVLGQVRVRACAAAQARQLLAWSASWPHRAWAVEGAAWVWGTCFAQQLVAAGERVLDMQSAQAGYARVRSAGQREREQERSQRCTLGRHRGAALTVVPAGQAR